MTEDGAGAPGEVRVLSGTPHSSIGKALSILGIGRRRLLPVATLLSRLNTGVHAPDAGDLTATAGTVGLVHSRGLAV